MANPQLEDGYTRVANDLIEGGFARTNFSAYESRVLWVLLRKTYGWQKKEDKISVSQFVEKTGIKRRHVQRTVDKLEGRNIIIRDKETYTHTYSLQKDYEQWDRSEIGKNESSTSTGAGLLKVAPKEVTEVAPIQVPTKEKRKYIYIVSKESLATFLHTLNDLSLKTRDTVLHFLDRVRQGNKSKQLALSRVEKIVQELMMISSQYDEDNLILALEKTLTKEDYNWSSRNVTGYIEAIARNISEQNRQSQVEQKARKEKEVLAKIGGSELYEDIERIANERE
ncbi:MAG: replication protein [Deltaproteobacteria bacterium]|nr:replication protein [Deltaproteobacteria bacterium]